MPQAAPIGSQVGFVREASDGPIAIQGIVVQYEQDNVLLCVPSKALKDENNFYATIDTEGKPLEVGFVWVPEKALLKWKDSKEHYQE